MEVSLPSTSSEIPPEELPPPPVTDEPKSDSKNDKPMSEGAVKLRSWLNKSFQVEMTDGRVLIGIFLCTDRDANIILGSCSEYLPADKSKSPNEEPRMLGLVMIPGKHIVNLHIDNSQYMSALKNRIIKDVAKEKEVV